MRGVVGRCGPVQIRHAILIGDITSRPSLPQFLSLRPPQRGHVRRVAAVSAPTMGSHHVSDDKKTKEREEEKETADTRSVVEPPAVASSRPLEPPEKPLPGDCCGSGCVRCVWDVYYEELEAYQKSISSNKGDQ